MIERYSHYVMTCSLVTDDGGKTWRVRRLQYLSTRRESEGYKMVDIPEEFVNMRLKRIEQEE